MARHPDISWAQIVGFRNVMAHDYLEVEHDEIAGLLKSEIPPLKAAVSEMLARNGGMPRRP